MRFFDVENSLDYYSFGMLMPERFGGGDYRYSFNGMEKDDEVKGSGNSYTTTFRQYDARLGRWLSIDPLTNKYPNYSPYIAFNNSPVFYNDPSGLEGEVTINKEEGTIKVSAKYYYNKNNTNFESQAITKNRNVKKGPAKGEYKAQTELAKIFYKDFKMVDNDGKEWTVSFDIQFIGLDSQEEVDAKIKNDETANQLTYNSSVFKMNSDGSFRAAYWKWNTKKRGIVKNLAISPGILGDDGTTLAHEIAHSFGLPHAFDITGAKFEGWNCPGDPNHNGLRMENGGLMSYAKSVSLQSYELIFMLSNCIDIANQSSDNQISIILSGWVNKRKGTESQKKKYGDRIKK